MFALCLVKMRMTNGFSFSLHVNQLTNGLQALLYHYSITENMLVQH